MVIFAVTSQTDAPRALVSPFFARANWIVIAKTDAAIERDAIIRESIPNRGWTTDWVCEQILLRHPNVLITGFIAAPTLGAFDQAGIDVRLGPCCVPFEDLIREYRALPQPHPGARGESGAVGR